MVRKAPIVRRAFLGALGAIAFILGTTAIYPSTAAVYTSAPIMKTAEGGFAASSNAALTALKSTDFTSATRLGFYAAGDGPRVVYTSTNAPAR